VSPVAPDAQTFRKAGRAPILGHKTHFVVDGGKANIITAVESRAACEADGQAVGTLLDKHRAALGRQARELVGDRGYGSETALRDCVQRGVQPLLGISDSHKPPRRHQPRGGRRNLLTRVPKSAQTLVAALVRSIFAQPDQTAQKAGPGRQAPLWPLPSRPAHQ